MSTNYYWRIEPAVLPTGEEIRPDHSDPRYHLGKLSGGMFTWAQDPETVGVICQQRADEQIVEDEYLTPLTGREFLAVLTSATRGQRTDLVGQWFC